MLKEIEKSIIEAYRETNSYIGIISITNIEFAHQGTRSERVAIDFKEEIAIYNSINMESKRINGYYNYEVNGAPPFVLRKKYLVVFRNIVNLNRHFWPESFKILEGYDCLDIVKYCKKFNTT